MRFNLYLQAFSQLNEKYGNDTADTIKDNCHVMTYLKTSNHETAKKIEEKLGTYTTSNYSESKSSGGKQDGGSHSMSLQSRPLLYASEIQLINRPFSLVMDSGGRPAITKAPDLSKWLYNKMFGLGNEKHNTRVRSRREALRDREGEERKPAIWNVLEEIEEIKKKARGETIEKRQIEVLREVETKEDSQPPTDSPFKINVT